MLSTNLPIDGATAIKRLLCLRMPPCVQGLSCQASSTPGMQDHQCAQQYAFAQSSALPLDMQSTLKCLVKDCCFDKPYCSMMPGSTYTDPGATAIDAVDGNITSSLSTYGIGAVSTAAPTNASSAYIITYTVQDSSGNAAMPGIRHVVVACKAPTLLCSASDSTVYCSTSNGLCIQSVATIATTAAAAPTIKLVGQAVLGVTQGSSYLACPTPQPTNVICDRYGQTSCACLHASPGQFSVSC